MRFGILIFSLFLGCHIISHNSSFDAKTYQEYQNHQISLYLWEIEFDRNDGDSYLGSKDTNIEASFVLEAITSLNSDLSSTASEILERDVFAKTVRNHFIISKAIQLSLWKGVSFPQIPSEQDDNSSDSYFVFLFSQIGLRDREFFSHNSERVFVKYKNDLESTQITKYSNIPFISKKLQKYYSIRRNAPPFGEEKC